MTQLGSMALLLGALTAIGVLFALQVKLSSKDKPWGVFVIPSMLFILYLGSSLAIPLVGNQYYIQEYKTVDQMGNHLEMIVQVPKNSDNYAGSFSSLRIFDENRVLLDEIELYYNKNVAEPNESQNTYEPYIRQMLQNVKLNGSSMDAQDVADSIPLINMTFTAYPLVAFAKPFGIPIVLLILTGFITRAIQARRIRKRLINKIDIQSFQASQ